MKSIAILESGFDKELELQIAPELRAGFPNPAEEYLQDNLDFNRDLILPSLICGKLKVKE